MSLFSCSIKNPKVYKNNSPQFDIRKYFNGRLEAYGVVKDWRDKINQMILVKLILITFLMIAKSSFASNFNDLKTIGKTPLSFLGFKLYDIELRGEKPKFSYEQKLAIIIIYNKNFSKEELVDASIEEISRINSLQQNVNMIYQEKLNQIFVDVKKGDEKIAIYDPINGLEFYYNGKLLGKINDVIFAKNFIDVWLSEKARFRNVRDILIGLK